MKIDPDNHEPMQWPTPAPQIRLNEQRAELETLIKNRDCVVCESTPRIATNPPARDLILRCNCHPEKPKLKDMGNPTQRRIDAKYAELIRQSVTDKNGSIFNTEASNEMNQSQIAYDANGDPLADPLTGEVITVNMPSPTPVPAIYEPPMPLTPAQIQQTIDTLRAVVSNMTDGIHYGIIPGTNAKKMLWEPGAELLRMAFRLSWDYRFVEEREDFDTGVCYYRVEATVSDHLGNVGAKWEASCDSREKRFGRMDAGVRMNLVRDTAIKRAFVNLMRNATAASGEFVEAYDSAGEIDNDAPASRGAVVKTLTPLTACPLHKINWQIDNYKNRYHQHESGRCMFKSVMAQYFDKERDVRDWTSAQMNDWLKTNFGTTRSRLTDEDSIEAINRLKESRPTKPESTTTSETPSDATDGPESNETPVDGGNTPENEEPTPDTQANQPSWSDDQFADIERARGQRGITEQTAYENAGAMSPKEWALEHPDKTPEDYMRAISTE